MTSLNGAHGEGPSTSMNREQRRAATRRSRKFAAVGSGAVLVAGVAGPLTLMGSTASAAAPIEVTSLADDGTDGALITLREAIQQANTDPGPDVITFQTGLTGSIFLTSDLPKITEAVLIEGTGADVVTVDGQKEWAIFNFYEVAGGTNSISGLTITHGYANNEDGSGGAVFVYYGTADLNLTDLVITENYANNDGGGVSLYGAVGDVVITNTVISKNVADGGGGALYADEGDGTLTVTINNSTITGNTSTNQGGALYLNTADLTVENTTISGNKAADDGGGGVYLSDSTALIVNSTISGNTAGDGGGGGLYVSNGSDYSFTMRNSTVSGNEATGYGGGLYISDTNAGPVTIENSTISGNTAGTNGGAIYGSYGGLTIIQSTITDNKVLDPGDAAAVGGIQLGGTPAGAAPIKGASHAGDKRGGSGRQGQARPAAAGNGELELVGTIVAGNQGQDIGVYGGAPTASSDHSVLGTVDSSITVTDVGVGGTQLGVTDPGLAPLASNGGPTQTHALLDGSPAFNAGGESVPDFPGNAYDQRGPGYARVVFGFVDVGAFEAQAPLAPPEPEPEPAAAVEVPPTFTG